MEISIDEFKYNIQSKATRQLENEIKNYDQKLKE